MPRKAPVPHHKLLLLLLLMTLLYIFHQGSSGDMSQPSFLRKQTQRASSAAIQQKSPDVQQGFWRKR